jgi:uncharacterized protein YjdB
MISAFGQMVRSLRAIAGARAGLLRGTAALALAGLAACGGDQGPPRVASVTISPSPASVMQGATLALVATPRDGSGVSISALTATWQSNNSSIASVNTTSGVVTGVSAGNATITATISGVSGTVTVTVTPPPVASLTISPNPASVAVGNTIPLTALLRDAGGTILTGRSIAWTSQTQSVATVDPSSGVATGVSTGTSLITATSEGVSNSVTLTVTGMQIPVTISGIAPNPLVAGGNVTITGTGFSPATAGNTVTVGGYTANVTAATETSLTFALSSAICLPTALTVVRVAVGGQSAQANHPFQSSVAPLNVAVGQQLRLTNPANFCLHIPARAAPEFLIIGVQSVSDVASSLTPVVVRGSVAAGSAAAAARTTTAALKSAGAAISPVMMRLDPAATLRRNRHRQAELAIRAQEQAILRAPRLRTADAQVASSAMQVPPSTQVGDTVSIRVPNRTNICFNPTTIRGVVRHRGFRAFWVEDVTNPAGGFTAGDYQNLGDLFDNQVWNTNTSYFGTPSDRDANSRIVIVVTREINRTPNLLGFVSLGDLQPPNCPASNDGEYFYGIAPDPTGSFDLDDARAEWPILIAHEFTHIIQFSRRLQVAPSGPLQAVWELEGQATLAEEVVGHAVTGNQVRQNLGANLAINRNQNGDPIHPISWYFAPVLDLLFYMGWDGSGTGGRTFGAPEQCTWLTTATVGPCFGSGRSAYGVSWAFLRWLSDHFGPSFAGGEQGLHRALITSTDAGYANISNRVGEPMEQLLSQWAATLLVDDRMTGSDPRLTMPSWNLAEINFLGLVNPDTGEEIQGSRPLGLRPYVRPFGDFVDLINVRSGSSAYFQFSAPSHQATSISFSSQSGSLPSTTRVWVVRAQ